MRDLISEMIEKVAAEAEAADLDLSPEEVAAVTYEKLAQESEEGESAEHEESESEEKEEGEQEEGEEAAEKKAEEEAAQAQEILEQAVSEAVDEVAAEAPEEASAEEIAAEAAPLVEEKISSFLKQAGAPSMEAVDAVVGKGGLSRAWDWLKGPTSGAKWTRRGATAAGGAAGGLGLASVLRDKQSSLSFETEVVKTARDILASSGFDPETGTPISKVALAQNRDEAKYAAALELLESRGWPVSWDPQFLARGAKEAK